MLLHSIKLWTAHLTCVSAGLAVSTVGIDTLAPGAPDWISATASGAVLIGALAAPPVDGLVRELVQVRVRNVPMVTARLERRLRSEWPQIARDCGLTIEDSSRGKSQVFKTTIASTRPTAYGLAVLLQAPRGRVSARSILLTQDLLESSLAKLTSANMTVNMGRVHGKGDLVTLELHLLDPLESLLEVTDERWFE